MEKRWEASTAVWNRGTGIVLPATVVATVLHSPTTSPVHLEALNRGRCLQYFYTVSVGWTLSPPVSECEDVFCAWFVLAQCSPFLSTLMQLLGCFIYLFID